MHILTEDLCFGYNQENTVLENINLDLEGNKLVSIIGPNGVGKSTLIHCFNKILTPTSGKVYINDVEIHEYKYKDLAKIIGYVPCSTTDTFPLTVTDTILLGRNPHRKWGSLDNDLAKVYEVLRMLDIEELAMRPFNELSAGQHQKVVLARGLAQEPEILLLDEPTSNLDIKHQMGVTKLLRDYARKNNVQVIMISHDLNIAAKYSDEVMMLYNKGIYAMGKPSDILTPENIKTVYGVDSDVLNIHNTPHVILKDENDVE